MSHPYGLSIVNIPNPPPPLPALLQAVTGIVLDHLTSYPMRFSSIPHQGFWSLLGASCCNLPGAPPRLPATGLIRNCPGYYTSQSSTWGGELAGIVAAEADCRVSHCYGAVVA